MVFLVVMYGCESWTVKKAEHRRIDAFELWYWRRLLAQLIIQPFNTLTQGACHTFKELLKVLPVQLGGNGISEVSSLDYGKLSA